MNGVLLEARDDGKPGRRWRIRVIRAGLSANGNYYPDAVLREATRLFDGARVFVKADADHLAGKGKDFRNLIGRLVEPAFVEGKSLDSGEIHATLEVLESAGDIAAKLREAWDRNMTETFGFSIDAAGQVTTGRIGAHSARIASRLTRVSSVDLIVDPGAGGQIINLIEANGASSMDGQLSQAAIADIVRASGLPATAQKRILQKFGLQAEVTEAALREAIDDARAFLAEASDSGKVKGLGDTPRIEVGDGPAEKTAARLDAFFDPSHKDHRHAQSIREAYIDATGDTRITGLIRNCDPVRFRESLNSQSWTDVLGDAITRRLIALYRTPNMYDVWRRVANVVPVQDFRTNERARYGGYGDLPIVGEGDPYPKLDSPTDEKATYAISKRGGTEDLTLEMIANDDVGAVRQIPVKLDRAAKRTLSKFVLDLIRTNATIYDGKALFHADHNNLGATALSDSSLAAGRLAMKRQTELNSGDRIGVGPRSLLVPDDLEETAVDLFRRNTENDKNFIQSLSLDVLPVWYWTDANNWYLAADPMDIPGIEVGFFQGYEEPELFIQDMPNVGSMFSNDKVTYKIRHIYGAVVVDYRAFYGAVVAD